MNGLYHTPISFMHNYFIFRKREQVNAKRISESFIKNEGGIHEALQVHLSAAAAPAERPTQSSAESKSHAAPSATTTKASDKSKGKLKKPTTADKLN